ncbi:MAG: DUF664 domain-containing protein [Terracoccus sp.]
MHTTSLVDPIIAQHHRIAAVVDGLDGAQLGRVILPSGWTPAGMLLHVGATTRFWCREVVLGMPVAAVVDEGSPFTAPPVQVATELVRGFVAGAVADLETVRGLPLDAAPAWWPKGRWGGWRLTDLEEVLLHLLVETSTHAGHLDAARELVDGGTFDHATGTVRKR